MVTDEIRVFLNDYFDVLQNQDMSLFDRVFHHDCVLYSTQDGQTVVRPYKVYRDMVQGRASPESVKAPRHDTILMLDSCLMKWPWQKYSCACLTTSWWTI